jgi:hypothetical protein
MLAAFRILPLLVPFPAAALAAQGHVWHVDDSGGADFTTVQAAIDAAADGDTIVIEFGDYTFFVVDAKALVITAAAGQKPYFGDTKSTVRNLSADQTVVLRSYTTNGSLALTDNQGTVWLEDVELGHAAPPSLFVASSVAIEAKNCASVVISRCSAHGAGTGPGGDGNAGLRAVGSTVHAFASVLAGANLSGPLPLDGAPLGGPGAWLEDSFLYAGACRIAGGQGSAGDSCSPGGAGGIGLLAGPGSHAALLGTLVIGGPGGEASAPGCPTGPIGTPSVEAGGAIDLLPGDGRKYALTSPADRGSTVLTYAGEPGDLVFSLVALAPSPAFLPDLGGTLVLLGPPAIFAHGPADPVTGAIAGLSIPLPDLPPGVQGLTVYAQGACITVAGDALLCTPSALTIL